MFSEEHIRTLVTLGLSGRQARICLALSLRGISTVKEITEATGIARPDTYRALVELENKGLIEKTLSNPAKYKILPLSEVLSILVGEKEAESIRLQESSAALLRDYRKVADQKPAEEGGSVLVPNGKAFTNRLDKLLENCKKNICIISSQKKLSQLIDSMSRVLTKKRFNEIHIRIVTEKRRSKSLGSISGLQKKVNLELRFAPFLPQFSVVTIDQKETLLVTDNANDNNRAYATYSNNPSLVELSQSYFNDAWFSANEPSGLAFKNNQLQLDHLFMNMLNGFAYCKMMFENGKPIDFIYIHINQAFEKITDLKRGEVIGKRASKIIPEIKNQQPDLLEIYGRVSCSGKAEEHELYFKPKKVWLHLSVYAPIKGYFAVVFEDVTERKIAEEALLESKSLIDTTFASINDAIIVFNLKGEVIKFNNAYIRLYGFKDEKEIPKSLKEFSELFEVFNSNGTLVTDLNSFLALNGQTGAREYVVKRKDTGQIWAVNYTYAPLFDKNGQLFAMVLSAQDITERKRNEEKLRRLNRTLKAIVSANQALIHATDETAFLREGCRLIQENCGYQTVWIGLAQDDEAKTVIPVASAGFEQGYIESLNITWAESAGNQSLVGRAIRTGQPQFCSNLAEEPSLRVWRAERAKSLKRGFTSSIVIPLKSAEKTFGIIAIFTLEPIDYSEDEIALLTQMADDFAYGITMLRLHHEKELVEKEAKVCWHNLSAVNQNNKQRNLCSRLTMKKETKTTPR
jgi:PAS domain S-box-containing protein